MVATVRLGDRRRAVGERGITLLEVTIAASLVLVVIASVLSVLDSFTRAGGHLDDRSDATGSRELALGEFTHDLRAAGELQAPLTSTDLRSRLVAEVVTETGPRTVRWDLTDAGILERSLPEAVPGSTDRRMVVDGLDPESSGFRYFDVEGRELVSGVETPEQVVRCAARIELHLVSGSSGGGALGDSRASVSLRNRGEVAGC